MTTGKLSAKITRFLEAATTAADILSQAQGMPLEYLHIEDALIDVLGLESAVDLLDKELTTNAIVTNLAKYDFQRLFPTILDEFHFDDSIIPADAPRRLIE